jgi:hypothetical protein
VERESGRLGGIGGLKRGRLGLALLGVCLLLVSGCGDDNGTAQKAALPEVVAQKRAAIAGAAKRLDYDGLRRLLDPTTFSYSFGETGDPIGYWRRLEREAEVPVVGDFLPTVLAAPVGRRANIYVWPAAHAKKPSRWTAADRRWLRSLYSAGDLRRFEQAGAYLGWRAGIRRDGKWLFFISGD